MSADRSASFAWYCALTTFVGALLLFLVQPFISKLILPWYGGSPAVWTTCMLFFQTVLLAGYAYADWLVRAHSLTWQMRIHGVVTLLAALTLPIAPGEWWEPTTGDAPLLSILLLLLCNVGAPFFALSATGPLVQTWFGGVYPGRPPYRLYALSNIGSLAALWLFPLLLEPRFTSTWQDILWSAGFACYLVSIFALAVSHRRMGAEEVSLKPGDPAKKPRDPVSWQDLLLWLALPAFASMALVSITNHICQDIPSGPFMWIMPLSLYLLAFILAFDSPRWYLRGLWGPLLALSMVAVSIVEANDAIQRAINKMPSLHAALTSLEGLFVTQEDSAKFDLEDYADEAGVQVAVALFALFCLSMVCLGETTRRKPHSGHLTLFYLLISAGGVIGSAIVAILCPFVFNRFYEFNVVIIAGYVGAGVVMVAQLNRMLFLSKTGRQVVTAIALCGLAVPLLLGGFYLTLSGQFRTTQEAGVENIFFRNFYGIASVQTRYDGDKPTSRFLYNGAINHGFQALEEPLRYEATTYYGGGAGVELAYHLLSRDSSVKLGVVGLGTGTMAAHAQANVGRPADVVVFYEIDDKIIDIADRYFTYVSDARDRGVTVRIDKGDARLTMKHQLQTTGSEKFDLLAIDAFSGDAIPVHLLTYEAVALYLQHLSDRGVLAVHVSNRHLNLVPVCARLAQELKVQAVLIKNKDGGGAHDAASDWVLMTNNQEVLDDQLIRLRGEPLTEADAGPLWTDAFSNLWQVLE